MAQSKTSRFETEHSVGHRRLRTGALSPFRDRQRDVFDIVVDDSRCEFLVST